MCVVSLLIWYCPSQKKGGVARNLLIFWIAICQFLPILVGCPRNLLICWIAICTFWAICLWKNVICALHFTVDLIVTEVILGGCRQRPADFLNCNLSILSNLSSKLFNMCASFSCWSDIVRGKRRGVSPETCWFFELQFVFKNI